METRILKLALCASLAALVSAFPQASVRVENATGQVNYPANFWTANSVVRTDGTYANPPWITSLAKAKVGLGNVDNTSDADKPISAAVQAALDGSVPVNHSAINYIFEGDSLTVGVTPGLDYPSLAMLLPPFHGGVKFNVATTMEGIEEITADYATQVSPRRPNGTTIKKAYLFLWIGANNYPYNGTHPMSASAFIDAWDDYIIQAKADGFTVVAFTVVRRNDAPYTSTTTDEPRRLQINQHIRSSDLYDALVDVDLLFPNPEDGTFFLPDKVHLQDVSNLLLARVVAATVSAGTLTSPTPVALSSSNTFDGPQTIVHSVTTSNSPALRLKVPDIGASPIGIYQAGVLKFRYYMEDSSANYYSLFDEAVGGFVWIARNGRLGVGNRYDPQEQLDVAGNCVVSGYYLLPGGVKIAAGTGTPEGAVSAPVGSTFSRTDGGAGTSFYVKESGAGNTGWIAK